MNTTWKYIFIQEWRFRWAGKLFLFFQILSPAVLLAIYWFTSEALGTLPSEKGWEGLNYFDFVSLGEILIIPALSASPCILRGVSTAHPLGILDDMLLSSKSVLKSLMGLGIGAFFTEVLVMVITIFLYLSLTELHFSPNHVLKVAFLVIFSLPFFIMLSLFAALIFLSYRRGAGLVSYLIMMSSIAAGVFFPLDVFPNWFVALLGWASPFTIMLQTSRDVLLNGSLPGFGFYIWFTGATFILWGAVAAFLPTARQLYLNRRVSEVVINYA